MRRRPPGQQSAVRTDTARPAPAVTRASAWHPSMKPAVTTATAGPWTCHVQCRRTPANPAAAISRSWFAARFAAGSRTADPIGLPRLSESNGGPLTPPTRVLNACPTPAAARAGER